MTTASWSTPCLLAAGQVRLAVAAPRPAALADRARIWRAAVTVTEPIGAALVRLAGRTFVKYASLVARG
jgi:hypothetical protein